LADAIGNEALAIIRSGIDPEEVPESPSQGGARQNAAGRRPRPPRGPMLRSVG
jgi:hypothetical protein